MEKRKEEAGRIATSQNEDTSAEDASGFIWHRIPSYATSKGVRSVVGLPPRKRALSDPGRLPRKESDGTTQSPGLQDASICSPKDQVEPVHDQEPPATPHSAYEIRDTTTDVSVSGHRSIRSEHNDQTLITPTKLSDSRTVSPDLSDPVTPTSLKAGSRVIDYIPIAWQSFQELSNEFKLISDDMQDLAHSKPDAALLALCDEIAARRRDAVYSIAKLLLGASHRAMRPHVLSGFAQPEAERRSLFESLQPGEFVWAIHGYEEPDDEWTTSGMNKTTSIYTGYNTKLRLFCVWSNGVDGLWGLPLYTNGGKDITELSEHARHHLQTLHDYRSPNQLPGDILTYRHGNLAGAKISVIPERIRVAGPGKRGFGRIAQESTYRLYDAVYKAQEDLQCRMRRNYLHQKLRGQMSRAEQYDQRPDTYKASAFREPGYQYVPARSTYDNGDSQQDSYDGYAQNQRQDLGDSNPKAGSMFKFVTHNSYHGATTNNFCIGGQSTEYEPRATQHPLRRDNRPWQYRHDPTSTQLPVSQPPVGLGQQREPVRSGMDIRTNIKTDVRPQSRPPITSVGRRFGGLGMGSGTYGTNHKRDRGYEDSSTDAGRRTKRPRYDK